MPPRSKAQHRLMAAKCHGSSTKKGGPDKTTACEYLHAGGGKPYKKLPERARRKGRPS